MRSSKTALGAWHIVEGKNGYVIHHQQDVVATVSKSEEGAYDQALAREVQGMSSQEFLEGFSDRDAEAISQMPSLISEALLTYAPTPKATSVARLAPAFNRNLSSIISRSVRFGSGVTGTGITQLTRTGSKGFATTLKDFGSLGLKNVRVITTARGVIRTGKLADGRTVIARAFSKGKPGKPGGPTLEIQNGGKIEIKIRY